MKLPPALRNLSIAALASLSLGGCYYGDVNGGSYASADCSSRYGDGYWTNDPYAYDDGYYGYDCYDAADYHSGFVQIGFGGGWYHDLYYPGHGLFLFDRYGRRHSMGPDYLTYWGGRRAWWKHHGRRGHHGDHYRGRDGHPDGRRPGRGYGRGDHGNAAQGDGVNGRQGGCRNRDGSNQQHHEWVGDAAGEIEQEGELERQRAEDREPDHLLAADLVADRAARQRAEREGGEVDEQIDLRPLHRHAELIDHVEGVVAAEAS
ncbi:MAG: hypothetical protein HC788_16115, partial [Sphingopyxis sp.]|nr:hypothetical protein [Sphingopyxis sp.]